MNLLRTRYVVASVVIIIILAFVVLIPVVPYTLSIHNPGLAYTVEGYQACAYIVGNPPSLNLSTQQAYDRCLAPYLIPPINVTGYGSLSFSLSGFGLSPFPKTMVVGENGFAAILYMSGGKASAAEGVPESDVAYDPPGIDIDNLSLSVGYLGNNTLGVSVTNLSGQTVADPFVSTSIPGDSGNYTDQYGLTWTYTSTFGAPVGPIYVPCLVNGEVQNLTTGDSCTATLHPLITVSPSLTFAYSVEVMGYMGKQFFVTRESSSYSISAQTMNQLWVDDFISLVNAARANSTLTESSTLDSFAAMRFRTAVTQPDISDYGFQDDVSSFFGANATRPAIAEDLLFPNMTSQDPYTFVSTLQGSAPGHWASLTDEDYTHFGFYIGTGPYEVVKLPCPVTEIPGGGINITQYFENAGCSVSVQQSTWLVVVLSS